MTSALGLLSIILPFICLLSFLSFSLFKSLLFHLSLGRLSNFVRLGFVLHFVGGTPDFISHSLVLMLVRRRYRLDLGYCGYEIVISAASDLGVTSSAGAGRRIVEPYGRLTLTLICHVHRLDSRFCFRMKYWVTLTLRFVLHLWIGTGALLRFEVLVLIFSNLNLNSNLDSQHTHFLNSP